MPSANEKGQQEMWETKPEEAASPPAVMSPEERGLRLKRVNRQQMGLRAVEGGKLIEADHVARAIWGLVGRVDLSRVRAGIEWGGGGGGRPAVDRQLLIRRWID